MCGVICRTALHWLLCPSVRWFGYRTRPRTREDNAIRRRSERRTDQGQNGNHNNGLTHGKQHVNTRPLHYRKSKERDIELYRLDEWTTPLIEM
jgi:hypothetical protein